jgi:hypothetical protein
MLRRQWEQGNAPIAGFHHHVDHEFLRAPAPTVSAEEEGLCQRDVKRLSALLKSASSPAARMMSSRMQALLLPDTG